MSNVRELNTCVCCDSSDLQLLLDFGKQPLANSFHREYEILEEFPLALNLCKNCYHLQLTHAVNPDLMFKEYLYVSGTSKTMRDYLKWFANFVHEENDGCGTVLDIGCNDGTLLDCFKDLNWDTYGIDPAENLHRQSSGRNFVVCDYFTKTSEFPLKTFDILVAQNVFAHNQNQLEFLMACKEKMHDNSNLYIQTSQANMIKENQFDTIYHEHISFFNINSFLALAHRAGLYVNDVMKTTIHGISYLFVLSKYPKNKNRVRMLKDVEALEGLNSLTTYTEYQKTVQHTIQEFKRTIKFLSETGYTLVGYGAAAKGMTFLNACETKLDFILDDNELKQNLYSPGLNIPIIAPEKLTDLPDTFKVAFIPLAWNYYDEIRDKIMKLRDTKNDVFVKYFPTVEVF